MPIEKGFATWCKITKDRVNVVERGYQVIVTASVESVEGMFWLLVGQTRSP
jgi:hypothetical protein